MERRSTESKERGATLAEYAVLASLVAVVALAAVRSLGYSTADTYCEVAGYLIDSDKPIPFSPWMFDKNWKEGNGGVPCKRSRGRF